ncbi:Rho guanine nucleotide exchange factor [Marasmius sp. AFHP31]|nr:Rho guanine nucleotide exchange factor [Marasmius sp. AFHP31]
MAMCSTAFTSHRRVGDVFNTDSLRPGLNVPHETPWLKLAVGMGNNGQAGADITTTRTLIAEDKEFKALVEELQAILEDDEQRQGILRKQGDDAQAWLDLFQLVADSPGISPPLRSTIFKAMLRLSKESGRYPKCLVIQNAVKQGNRAVSGGGFGDVWKGTIGRPGSVQTRLLRNYIREAIVWKQLKHPNILPFLGIYYLDDARQDICLISPWMDRGNLVQYLKATPQRSVNHMLLVFDVASGLSHLHDMAIVHADLKGVNVLIMPSGRACIGDFGLSRVADPQLLRITSSTSRALGSVRWLAPELLEAESIPTKDSDIYAFACVCYEIFTGGLLPFHEFKHDAGVMHQLSLGNRPSRAATFPVLSDAILWNLMEACWQTARSVRPDASTVVRVLIAVSPAPLTIAPAWPDSMVTGVWNNVNHPITNNAPANPIGDRNTDQLLGSPGMYTQRIRDLLRCLKKGGREHGRKELEAPRQEAVSRLEERDEQERLRLRHFWEEERTTQAEVPSLLPSPRLLETSPRPTLTLRPVQPTPLRSHRADRTVWRPARNPTPLSARYPSFRVQESPLCRPSTAPLPPLTMRTSHRRHPFARVPVDDNSSPGYPGDPPSYPATRLSPPPRGSDNLRRSQGLRRDKERETEGGREENRVREREWETEAGVEYAGQEGLERVRKVELSLSHTLTQLQELAGERTIRAMQVRQARQEELTREHDGDLELAKERARHIEKITKNRSWPFLTCTR